MKLILLGSGPSLRAVSAFSVAEGRPVLAVNTAAMWMPNGATLFSADRVWIVNHEQDIYEFTGPVVLAQNGQIRQGDYGLHVQWVAARRCKGLAADGVNGSTSGFAALNWAVRCGAKRIFLLGYDYRSDGPHRHWYDEEEPTEEEGRAVDLWSQWIAPFNEALPELQQLGVQVMNGSPESAITAFPKCSPEEGLRWFDSC